MSKDTETNPNNVPVRRRPVNIPLVERINKHHDEDFIDRPQDENHIPMNNSNDHMVAHDDISKTPDEHDLMNELDKLFAKNGISEEVSYSPTTSDSSSKSQSSIPKKNSLQTLRRSPSLNKYTAHNPAFKELQPKSSNETLTLDEDGHDSSMEDICASDQYMNVDEVDAMPLSLSPKMVYSPKHQQQLDDISEDFEDLIKVEEEEEDDDDDDEDMPFPSMGQDVVFSNADDHDYNIPVENKRLRMELDKKAKSLENMYRDDQIFDNSYESNAVRSISKASLDWEYKEYQEFILEVEHWFCLTLGLDSKIMESNISNNTLFNDMIWYVKELQDLTKLTNFDDLNEMSFNTIEMCQRLLHYTLGNFIRTAVKSELDDDLQHFMNDEYQQFKFLERRMIINCKVILKDKDLLHKVLCMVKQHMTLVKLENDNHITVYNTLLKLSSSILFIIVCACLQDMNNDYIETFRELIDELDFMSFITEYIESWRFTYKPSMNMRLILVLFNKLIIFQFGTSSELKDIQTKINDEVSAGSGKNCNSFDVSQYESIRQDLITRYPELSSEIEIIDEYKYDMSYSSVQFINVPRPKKDMLSNMIANGKNVGSLFNNSVPNIQLVGSTTTTTDPYNINKRLSNSTNISIPMIQPTNDRIKITGALKEKIELLKDSLKNRDVKSMQIAYWKIRYYYYELGIESADIEINTKDGVIQKDKIEFDEGEQNQHYERIHNYYLANHHRLGSLTIIILKLLENLSIAEDSLTSILRSNIIEVLMNLLIRFSQQNAMKAEYLKTIIFDYRGIEIFCDILKNENVDRYMTLFYHKEKWTFWNYLKEFCHEYKNQNDIVVPLNIESCYDDIDQDYDSRYLNMEYGLLYCLEKVIDGRTQRLKFLPLNIGTLFKSQYKIYNLCIYKPLLELIRQLTPFKSKKWRAEHMELITGVYMYLKLPLIENDWVTGKDTNGEILDAVNIELGIRSLIKFYNVMIKKQDELSFY